MLRNCLLHGIFLFGFYWRSFALDNYERNSVNEEHNIRTAFLIASGLFNFEFLGYMKNILVPIFPVNVFERTAFLVPFNCLLKTLAQAEQIKYALACFNKAFVQSYVF